MAVGMARSGVAAVRLLQQKGALVRAVDEKPIGEVLGVTVEPQTEAAFRDAELVVISPGVPADLDLLKRCRDLGIVRVNVALAAANAAEALPILDKWAAFKSQI